MSLPRLTEAEAHPNNVLMMLLKGGWIYVENGAAKAWYDKDTDEYVYEPLHNDQLTQRRFTDFIAFVGFIAFAYAEYA